LKCISWFKHGLSWLCKCCCVKCGVLAFVGQMKPRSQGHWASWMILVRGREERLRVRLQYRRWLWTWWNSIYTGLSKEGLHISRLLPWPNLKLSSLINPHQIRSRWHCSKFYAFWWKRIDWLCFFVAILSVILSLLSAHSCRHLLMLRGIWRSKKHQWTD